MTYTVDFMVGDRIVARGQVWSVCCDMRHEGAGLRAVAVPESLAERLAEAETIER